LKKMKMVEVVKIGAALGCKHSAFGYGRGWASPNAEYRDRKLQALQTSGRVRCGLMEDLHRPDEARRDGFGGEHRRMGEDVASVVVAADDIQMDYERAAASFHGD
jgi:hypothetical protein